jgi:hypothetical protein
MKIVKLSRPMAVDTHNPPRGFAELRQPVEGALLVSDDEAERLKAASALDGEPEDVPEDDEPEDAPEIPDDLKDLKVAELKALALKDGVPLHDATTKPAIIAAFVAHRASKSQEA